MVSANREMVVYCFDTLVAHYNDEQVPPPAFDEGQHPLFVTWKKVVNGYEPRLRGCIGTLSPRGIVNGFKDYALTSALRDHRFPPIQAKELPSLQCTVSILTNYENAASHLDWEVGKHGIIIENAMLYNPRTDDVHGMADQMLRIFEDLFRPIQAKLTKSNERGNGNERVGNVHGMGNNARVFDIANERVVNVNDMVNDVVNEVNRVNEFSAVDELDGSSWDDVQTPERTKKAKSEGKSSGFPAASKQIHSTASNAVIPPVVHSPVRMPSRLPSPMQVPEPVKPSNTSTMTKTVFPKLPKPRAKDPNKREMNMEEKQKLGLGLQSMPPEKMPQLLQIIRKRNDQLAQEGDEIELDIEALDTETLWELDRFVTNWKKFVSKTKRQALMVNSASAVAAPSVSADIDDVPMSEKMDGVKKSKKDAGEEDVDIGDEMPESSFPHVEIEKDDGGGGQGQAVTGGGQGNNDNNASSSSSGSSSCGGWLIQTVERECNQI